MSSADIVIDALDPFAEQSVRALRLALRKVDVPHVTYRRSVWDRHPLDRWIEVGTLDGAVNAVASVARTVLLALPTSDVSAFELVGGLVFPVRLTDGALPGGLPPRFRAIDVGGASSVVRETRILSETKPGRGDAGERGADG